MKENTPSIFAVLSGLIVVVLLAILPSLFITVTTSVVYAAALTVSALYVFLYIQTRAVWYNVIGLALIYSALWLAYYFVAIHRAA